MIPIQKSTVPNGTYVIRKGRDRKQVFDIPEFVPPTANAKEPDIESLLESSQELLSIEEPNDIPQPPMNIPKYRHSIDLALPSMQSSIHSKYDALQYALVLFCLRSLNILFIVSDIRITIRFGQNQMMAS